MPEQIQNAQTATQSIIGASMGMATAVSLMNMSSPVAVWSIINQFQMFMLLLLTGAFIPLTVKHYLSGMDFALNFFGLIPFYKVPLLAHLYSWMKFEQYNDDLHEIGVEDGSTAVNNLSFLIMLLLFIILHTIIAILYTRTKSKTGLCNRLIKITYNLMTFTVYIRLLLENYQYMLLASISEAYKFNLSAENKLASLVISYMFLISCIAFYVFIIYQFYVTLIWLNRKYHPYFDELFAGLKESNKARLYTILLVTRRLVL